MQTQPKYESKVKTVVMGNTIKNLTPILPQRNGNSANVK